MQMAKAGLKAIYLSGWQVSADYNLAAQTYPDLGLYPVNSAPRLVEAINNALSELTRLHTWKEQRVTLTTFCLLLLIAKLDLVGH